MRGQRAVAEPQVRAYLAAVAAGLRGPFVVTGPLVGVWWLLLLHPHPWRAGVAALVAARSRWSRWSRSRCSLSPGRSPRLAA
jgi:hypothetical protein